MREPANYIAHSGLTRTTAWLPDVYDTTAADCFGGTPRSGLHFGISANARLLLRRCVPAWDVGRLVQRLPASGIGQLVLTNDQRFILDRLAMKHPPHRTIDLACGFHDVVNVVHVHSGKFLVASIYHLLSSTV